MLIANLGRTRRKLLASLDGLSDEHLNKSPSNGRWSIGQIVCHVCNTEKGIVETVLDALPSTSGKVEERDVSLLIERYESNEAKTAPQAGFLTKAELIRLLEESRFKYLQSVFNKTHESSLAEKSMDHLLFGKISLKNLIDFIWLHEQYHIDHIEETKKSLPK
ncbi:DinB family protein [bacterium]|nr:MAG: DinB family protein [bacterium]